ncbi:MAG: hypothetical protein GTO24_05185, partial [candidate division Zixibacteria bacterium]|nr:hypothetical protein [candidate division Zixibacteria bacterium]
MPLAEGVLASTIGAVLYSGLKAWGAWFLGPHWSTFRKAHKNAIKKIKKDFKDKELLGLFGNYVNMELSLEFDRSKKKDVIENLKKGVKGFDKEVFIDKIAQELHESSKTYKKELLRQVVTSYIQEVEVQLRDNHEILNYLMDAKLSILLERIPERNERVGDFLENVWLEPIPDVPPHFVLPKDSYREMMETLDKSSSFLVKGGAGIGKTKFCAYLAREFEHEDKPVFWYQITGPVDSYIPVLNRIAYFLASHGQQDLFEYLVSRRTDDRMKMDLLLKELGEQECCLFFDDLHKVDDKKLANFMDMLCRRLGPGVETKVFLLSRHLPSFIDESCLQPISIEGLSPTETKSVLSKLDVGLEEGQADALAKKTRGNPKYVEFFKAWYTKKKSKEEIDEYITGMPAEDNELQTYLVNNVYSDRLTPNQKMLLQSVAIFRIPETKDFLEEVYAFKKGKDFNGVLDQLQRRLLLIDLHRETQRYYEHDILTAFLQNRID